MLESVFGALDSLEILEIAEFAQAGEVVVNFRAAFVEVKGLRELCLVDALELLWKPSWVGVLGDLRAARGLGGVRVVSLETDEALRAHGTGSTPVGQVLAVWVRNDRVVQIEGLLLLIQTLIVDLNHASTLYRLIQIYL